MTLNAASIDWAIDFVVNHSDGDLFPRVLETEAIQALRSDFITLIEGKDLQNFPAGVHRRFIVPKDDISYRVATQLDPQDSIILSAIIREYGGGIEARRSSHDRVFSYRFDSNSPSELYASRVSWNNFWTAAFSESFGCSKILYCDIADFYNQIYHHTVENQLIASNFPNQVIKWMVRLLESTTTGVSRGVPVGPHGIHLIAEATMIPIDNSMDFAGLRFLRYADDIIVFFRSERESKRALGTIASILDKQQRLMIQRHKVMFMDPDEFRELSSQMIEDRPINADEDRLLSIIKKYSGGNPYATVSYNRMTKEEWRSITDNTVERIIREYMNQDEIDYIRLRWFYRRLAQIGHPGAIQVSLDELSRLGPCLSNICSYIASVQSITETDWEKIGSRLVETMKLDEVKDNEYFRLSILSLFSRNTSIDNFRNLASLFQSGDPFVRREILLAARVNGAVDWLREHKEDFAGMDPWQRRAFVYCSSTFPTDERRFFIGRWSFDRPFDMVLAKWARSV